MYLPAIEAAFPAIKQFITLAQLQPYDLTPEPGRITPAKARSRGELKYVIVTAAPNDDLMITLVLRSTSDLARIKSKLPLLQAQLPKLRVFSINIQPEHKATLIGDREILLTEQTNLTMPVGSVQLRLGPTSFFQTNTFIAEKLYAEAAAWVNEISAHPASGINQELTKPMRIWDMYCGVGGFALTLAGPNRHVTGIELSPEAITNANAALAQYGALRGDFLPGDSLLGDFDGHTAMDSQNSAPQLPNVTFLAQDATEFALTTSQPNPDLIVVNPPRRGIGIELTNWINNSSIPYVLYSSCNPNTLAADLENLTNYQVTKAQLFDMFPNTTHSEVLTLLRKRSTIN
jgi:23S rRNA (uracil747-C5)-methyltransferase